MPIYIKKDIIKRCDMETKDILLDIRDELRVQSKLRVMGMLYRKIDFIDIDKEFLEGVANGTN